MKYSKLYLVAGLGLSLGACATNMNTEIVTNNNRVLTEYPIETAMINIYAKPHTATILHGTIENLNIITEIKVTPKGEVIFNDQLVQAGEVDSTTKVNNQIIGQYAAVNYYTLDPLIFRGFTMDAKYSVATQTATIPKRAKVGTSSTYLTENVYGGSSKRDLIERYTQTWLLSQADNDTAWLCIVSSTNLLLESDPEEALSECHNINNDGDILESRIGGIDDDNNGMIIINLDES